MNPDKHGARACRHHQNIVRYRRMLGTYLTSGERAYARRRIAKEKAALRELAEHGDDAPRERRVRATSTDQARGRVFRVDFFKVRLRSDGRSLRSLQHSIRIVSASPDQAVEEAQQQFERQRQIPSWRVHADTLEVVEDDDSAAAALPTGSSG